MLSLQKPMGHLNMVFVTLFFFNCFRFRPRHPSEELQGIRNDPMPHICGISVRRNGGRRNCGVSPTMHSVDDSRGLHLSRNVNITVNQLAFASGHWLSWVVFLPSYLFISVCSVIIFVLVTFLIIIIIISLTTTVIHIWITIPFEWPRFSHQYSVLFHKSRH